MDNFTIVEERRVSVIRYEVVVKGGQSIYEAQPFFAIGGIVESF